MGVGRRGVLTAAGQLGQQEVATATSPWTLGATTLSSSGCCGPEPPIMGLGR